MANRLLVILVFGALLVFAGCGVGGSAVTTAVPGPVEKGSITIALTPAPASAHALAAVLPAPTHVRILIVNTTTGFKVFQDVAVPASSSVTIPVPVATGYTVYGLSYIKETYMRRILKFAKVESVNVAANVNTPVDITLQPIVPPVITLPSSVTAGDQYAVSVSSSFPLMQNECFCNTSLSPFTTTTDLGGREFFTTTAQFNAPTSALAGNLYFQFEFFLDPQLVDPSEGPAGGWNYWSYFYTNPTYGETQLSVPLSVPSGGIAVGVTY